MSIVLSIILLCIVNLIELTQGAKYSCHNYDDTAIAFDNLKLSTTSWYPLMTSRNPENRKCERIIFTKNNETNTLDWESVNESGDKVNGKYKSEGRSKLQDPVGGSFSYFLTTDKDRTKYIITYSCKTYGDHIIKELFTIYGGKRNAPTKDIMNAFTKIGANGTTKGVYMLPVDQQGCKMMAPVANKEFRFNEDDLVNFESGKVCKVQGNWIQKAVSHNQTEHLYQRYTAKCGSHQNIDANYYFSNDSKQCRSKLLPGSKVYEREFLNDTGSKFYDYWLYFDGHYLITFSVPVNSDSPLGYYLDVAVKNDNGVVFDILTLYDILMTRIRANARRVIEGLIFDLNFKDEEHKNQLIAKSNKNFTEDELATIAFEQISNVYELRYSSDPYKLFDIQVSFLAGKNLKTYSSSKNGDVVRNITDFHVLNSKRIFRVTNNKFSEISYLFADDNYLVCYEFFEGEENLRLFARQSTPMDIKSYQTVMDKIKSTATEKIQNLVSKLTVHSESQSDTLI